MVTVVHEEVTYCSSSTSSGKQKQNHSNSQLQFRTENTIATIKADQFLLDLQQLANINTSSNFHKKSTEFPTCQSHSPQRWQRLTGNLKSSSCLKIFSKRASKITISWLKMTKSTTSTISWRKRRYRQLKTIMTQPERIWEKFWQFSEGST